MPAKFFLGSMGTSIGNNVMARENAREQRNWQERMWHMQNAYNSPLNQKLLKLAAGVNPYENTGFVPAGSVGNGATADTFPLSDPLAALKTFAEVDNLDMHTSKMEVETQKLLMEIAMLDLEFDRGLLSNKEYKKRLELMFDEWSKRNPYSVDRENTESQTRSNIAAADLSSESAAKIESDRLFTQALTLTENALRDVRVNVEKSKAAANNASASASLAQASKLLLEGKTIEQQIERDAIRNSAMQFYGFDPTTLPSELAATLMNNFAAVVERNFDPAAAKEAMDKAHKVLETYRHKAVWTPTTDNYSYNGSVGYGPFQISFGQSFGKSN